MHPVGRKRKTGKHLPARMYYRHGAYYYVSWQGTWKRLSKDYSEALRLYAAFQERGCPADTVEMLVAKYDAEELTFKAAKTRQGRRQEFKNILRVFGHMAPDDVEPAHIWQYWVARKRIEQARHEIRAFSTLMTFARRIGARKRNNPCYGLHLPMSRPRARYVTDDEFLLVRDIAPPMVGYAMDLALLGGMDQGTIRRLERKNLTPEGIQFERQKTKELQLIEWNEELDLTVKAILRERPQLRRALICNRRGQPYSMNGFQSQWQRVMRKAKGAGLKETFHFHDLRAKSASDAENDQQAADRLGHGDVRLTRKVYRRLPRRAVALRILDNGR